MSNQTQTTRQAAPAKPTLQQDLDSVVEILDVIDALPAAARLRTATYEALDVSPGSRTIDVGCGTGLAVQEMTDLGAQVLGIDADARMVHVARRRRAALDLRCADAYNLPVSDGELDAYRADKVFHELDDPARALTEAHRVLAGGGRIALLGQDWDAIIVDSDEPELTRRIVAARADAAPSPWAARAYRSLLFGTGFTNVRVEGFLAVFTEPFAVSMIAGFAEAAQAHGTISESEKARWDAEQRHRAHGERLLVAIPLLLATARKPK